MTTPDRHREGVACGDPHAAHLSWPKHTWIAASKHRFLLAMTNRTVIAKVRSTPRDPLARNLSGQGTLDCRVALKGSSQ